MKIRFLNDPETDLPHIFKHNVTEEEVIEVVRRPMEHRRGGGRSLVIVGKTEEGRILRVICSDSHNDMFVVTAYDLEGNALKAFKRRHRR